MGVDFPEPHPSPEMTLTFFQDKREKGPLETVPRPRFCPAAEANKAQEATSSSSPPPPHQCLLWPNPFPGDWL